MNFAPLFELLSKHPALAPAALGGVAFVAFVVLWIRAYEIKTSLRTCSTALSEWSPELPTAREHDVCSFVRHHLVGFASVQLPDWKSPRLLVSKDIDEILDAFVERRTASTRFVVGPLATAAALICTFLLIAHVLENDVGSAVAGATSAGVESNAALSTAVRTLGAKFYISATGIGASVVFAIAIPRFRTGMFHLAHDAARQLSERFCTPATLAAVTQLELLREAQERRARESERDRREQDRDKREHDRDKREHDRDMREIEAIRASDEKYAALTMRMSDIGKHLQGMRADLAQLQSIDVSVKDLGTEVTAQLRHMLTEDLGVQMKEMLADVMGEAATLSEKLQKQILDGLEQTLQRQIPEILESLQAIQKSVDGQAQSPIERLLEQLQGVVAGGIRGESAQMTNAIKQFAEVVPALAEQLRQTAQTHTTDMRTRTDENVRASEALVSQVSGLLVRLEEQQAATHRLVEDIGRAASNSAESLVQKVQSESAALFGELLRTSRDDVDQMLGKLREATTVSAGNYSSLESSVSATSQAILTARDGLQSAAEAIGKLTADSRAVIVEAKNSHEVAARASVAFDRSATELRSGVESLKQAVDGARAHASEQAKLLEQHRHALVELEKLWPTLFDAYIRNFDAKSKQLLQNWDEFFKKTGAFSETAGRGLADAAEELLGAVTQLARLQQGKRP